MRLPTNRNEWPAIWRERYEERAAILEYDAGMDRKRAESAALWMVMAEAAKQ